MQTALEFIDVLKEISNVQGVDTPAAVHIGSNHYICTLNDWGLLSISSAAELKCSVESVMISDFG